MAVAGDIAIAKAGWLHRESSMLRRWKKSWFVLYCDGILRYFENQDSHVPEAFVLLKMDCVAVKFGKNCNTSSPPEGKDKRAIFSLEFLSQAPWNLCAEDADDMHAWHLAIEDLRQGGPRAGGAQSAQYPRQQQYPAMYPQQTVIYNTPTVIPSMAPPNVIYTSQPSYPHFGFHNRYYGGGLSFGNTMATPGAVLHRPGGNVTVVSNNVYW